MSLGVDLEATRQQFTDAKAEELRQEEGDSVKLVLRLPDGVEAQHDFKLGHTVAYVKLEIEQKHGLPMAQLQLKMGGKVLIDPFSLADIAAITPGGVNLVDVTLSA